MTDIYCPRCKKTKTKQNFSPSTQGKLHAYCKPCRAEQVRLSRQKNPGKYRETARKYRERDPAQRLLMATRQSAVIKNLEHNITKEDLSLPTHCPILGIEIDYTAGTGKTMLKPSVDRINPNFGYVKGNVEVISSLANTMKCNASPELLIVFSKEMLRRYEV